MSSFEKELTREINLCAARELTRIDASKLDQLNDAELQAFVDQAVSDAEKEAAGQ